MMNHKDKEKNKDAPHISSGVKIFIQYSFKEGGHGGGNQFLKALWKELWRNDQYAESPEDADVILFNSHHEIFEVLKLRRKYPEKAFIHRIDGPIVDARKNDKYTDKIIYKLNRLVADGTIFQSKWSQERNHAEGLPESECETVVHNAPDPEIFHPKESSLLSKDHKTRLIMTSWSGNERKGFSFIEYLDKNLDFSQYEMVFAGNAPIKFENIQDLGPLSSYELAEELRKSDIFVSGSQAESCPNALLEAMHCGLPAVLFDNPTHREVAGNGAVYFSHNEEFLQSIERVRENYEEHQSHISLPNISDTAKRYHAFGEEVLMNLNTKEKHKNSFYSTISFFFFIVSCRIKKKLNL